MGRGDRKKARWAKDRQRKKREHDKRIAEEKGKVRKGR